jgi:tetratricopeptide (TPR) repeat protein
MLRFKKTILISFFFLLNTQVYAKSSILDDVSTFIDILNGAVTFLKTLEDMGKSSSKNIREKKSDYLASEKKRKDAYEIEESGNIRIATNLYKESTDLDPTNKKAWHGYGGALLKENKYSEAEQAFSEAIFLDDSTSSSWKYLGSTYEQWGKLKSAAFCYAEAYKREKDNKKIKQGIENVFITLKEKGIYTKITNHGDMYFFHI